MDSHYYDFSSLDLKVSMYDGAAEKRTMYMGGYRYMVKFGYVLDPDKRNSTRTSYVNLPVNEYIGSNIFAAVGIPAQRTLLGEWRGQSVVACLDFMQRLNPVYRLLHFKQLEVSMPGESGRSKARPEWDFVRHVLEDSPDLDAVREPAMRRFRQMICVDALIGNYDRHSNNWGFIADGNANIIDLAPIYDCGSSLAPHLSVEEMQARLADSKLMRDANLDSPTMAMNVHGKRRKYAYFLTGPHGAEFRRELIDLWPRLGKDVTDPVIDAVPHLDDLHRDFYRATLDARRQYVLKPAYELALKEQRDVGLDHDEAVHRPKVLPMQSHHSKRCAL